MEEALLLLREQVGELDVAEERLRRCEAADAREAVGVGGAEPPDVVVLHRLTNLLGVGADLAGRVGRTAAASGEGHNRNREDGKGCERTFIRILLLRCPVRFRQLGWAPSLSIGRARAGLYDPSGARAFGSPPGL